MATAVVYMRRGGLLRELGGRCLRSAGVAMPFPDRPGPAAHPPSRTFVVESSAGALAAIKATTGLPWWAAISGVTVGLRFALLPFTLKQRQAMAALQAVARDLRQAPGDEGGPKEGAEFWSVAARTWVRRARGAGVTGPVWLFTPIFAHLPVFVTMMLTVRHLASSGGHGMETGGILWFPDLTLPAFDLASYVAPMGPAGAILPGAVVLFYHYTIQQTFRRPDGESSDPPMSTLLLRTALEWLTIPMLLVGLQVPHGVFCYWLTSSAFNIAQNPILASDAARRLLLEAPKAPSGGRAEESASEAPKASESLFARARELAGEGKESATVVLDAEGIAKLTQDECMNVARTLAERGDWRQAHKMFLVAATKAESVESAGYVDACFWAGMAAARLGLDDGAQNLFERVLEKDPKNSQAMLALASVHKKVS